MGIKVKDLIKILAKKDQERECQVLVVGSDGLLDAMFLDTYESGDMSTVIQIMSRNAKANKLPPAKSA